MSNFKYTTDVDFRGHEDAQAQCYWRVYWKFGDDHALRLLSEDSRRELASVVTNWVLQFGRPSFSAVRVNLPKYLATTPFAVFGEGLAKHVANLTLQAWWTENYEEWNK